MQTVESASPKPDTARTFLPEKRASRVLVPLLILVFVLQCAWFIRTQSFTIDEPEHITAGLEAWHYGEFFHWHDQPPLARLWFTLPLLHTDWKYNIIDEEVNLLQPAPEKLLYPARAMNVVFGVALLLVLWGTARRLFSESAATFALALGVFSPELIAHSSLATIDMVGTLFIFAAVVQLMRWWRNPSRGQTILLGVILGALLLSKFNSPPLLALVLLCVLMLRAAKLGSAEARLLAWSPKRMLRAAKLGSAEARLLAWSPKRWNWRPAIAMLLLACLVVWAGYKFHVSRVLFADGNVTINFSGYTKQLVYELDGPKHLLMYLPACEWMTGLGMVIVHNMEGHRSFLLGHYSQTGGWKMYFPVAILLKWPLIVLLLGAAGLGVILWRRFPARRELLLMSIFPAVYFAFAIVSRINIGVRHVLPLYPFLLLYAAALWEWVRANRRAQIILAVLVVGLALDTLRYAPDYLSYFNVFIPQDQTWKYLSDSNNDWGQSLVALRKYQAAHPNETIHLAYFGQVDPANYYGIRYIPMREGDRPTGTVIVSATHLSGQLLKDHYAYRWLLQYPRKAILDHTLYVFEVPENSSSK